MVSLIKVAPDLKTKVSDITHSFDFSNNIGWTQVGTGVIIDTVDEQVEGWGTAVGVDRRIHFDMVTPLSDTKWTADFEFEFSAQSNPSHAPLILGDTSVDMDDGGTHDFIGMRVGISINQAVIIAGDETDIGAVTGSTVITIAISTRYFCRLQRTSATLTKLSIFSDSERTTHISGSPVTLTIASTLDVIQFIHSQNISGGGPGRDLTGIMDTLDIRDNKVL